MRPTLKLFIAAVFGFLASSAQAAHTQASLILAATTARPGDTVMAGVHLRMDPQWHTYWKNSGASGIPTTIKWDLPAGISAGPIEWPVPEKLPPDNLTTYIYEHEVVLLVPLKIEPGLASGSRELKANVSWLECQQECIPGSAQVQATLNIGSATTPSPDAKVIDSWQQKLPKSDKNLSAHAWWQRGAQGDTRPLILEWNSAINASETDFYPQGSEQFEVQGATERLPAEAGKIKLRKQVKKYQGDWPKQISGLLIEKSAGERLAYAVTLPIAASGEEAAAAGSAESGALAGANGPSIASNTLSRPLWEVLLYAFIGGLILNVMPCVLPVIGLKILGFVKDARNEPARARKLGLIYGLGVLLSFLVLAALVIGAKAAERSVSWGMQFSSPYFLLVMTVLVTLIALNLFGVFEITLGGRAMGVATALSSKHGAAGAFFNGLLATALATSCTAPFLGAAVGFALVQNGSYLLILTVFLTAGAGLAAPYVLLSWQPGWLKFLPKPGPWMEKFKVAMGFPMLAAGVWLCSLVSIYYGDRTWGLAIFLVFVALAAWVFGQFVQRSTLHRAWGLVATALLLFAGYAYALEGQLNWRKPNQESGTAAQSAQAPEGGQWQPWSKTAVAKAQQAGRPVLVDFTAKWCLTCQKDVKPVLESAAVRKKLKAIDAVTLLADYTRFPENITRELNRHGRAGVPLVLVYPGKPAEPPVVLPEFLTPGTVLNALDRVTR